MFKPDEIVVVNEKICKCGRCSVLKPGDRVIFIKAYNDQSCAVRNIEGKKFSGMGVFMFDPDYINCNIDDLM